MQAKNSVWYIAEGYQLPAGIEGYLLHYATEIRNHGFEPRIVVFKPLPKEKHRYLQALEDRNIRIYSIADHVRSEVLFKTLLLYLPWMLFTIILKRQNPFSCSFKTWISKKCMVAHLKRMIASEHPDIIHVKGRLISEAWDIFPPDGTIYHHALSGTVDPSWEPYEVEEFRKFANRIARVFAPGGNVAKVFAKEFGIDRRIDAIFTMAPDENKGDVSRKDAKNAKMRKGLRFGILCRFTEQKGIKYILEALRMYKDKYGDVDFTFAGAGELDDMIKDFISVNHLDNVRIIRVKTPYDVLKDIDVFVHPGLDDAMPVSIVEALMCSCPCIATNVGGVPDLIRNNVEGFLVEPASRWQIFDGMINFEEMSVEDFDGFRRRARARYEENCTPEKIGKILSDHYSEILTHPLNATLTA